MPYGAAIQREGAAEAADSSWHVRKREQNENGMKPSQLRQGACPLAAAEEGSCHMAQPYSEKELQRRRIRAGMYGKSRR